MSEESKIEETEFYSEYELIASAYNAIAAMDGYDPITKADKQRKNRILRRSITMIDECIGSLYAMFSEKVEEDDEDLE